MRSELRPALVLLFVFTVLTGVVYPLAITGLSRIMFPHQAEGSWIVRDGRVVGSRLIGQDFEGPQYFWGRLSATSPYPYNALLSTGSNFGPSNPALVEAAKKRAQALGAADSTTQGPIPVDLVTASGSGLDPEISPAAAAYQIARVARARGLSVERVTDLVRLYTKGRILGVLGEPRVNVLELNLALDLNHPSLLGK